ncbi:MAG: hypothetical protein ABSE39_02080 [Candidatus Bathyarchaeia archaeon]
MSSVTPSLNQGRFIGQTILSVRNQTYANLEHIVRVVVSEKNFGLAHSKNIIHFYDKGSDYMHALIQVGQAVTIVPDHRQTGERSPQGKTERLCRPIDTSVKRIAHTVPQIKIEYLLQMLMKVGEKAFALR